MGVSINLRKNQTGELTYAQADANFQNLASAVDTNTGSIQALNSDSGAAHIGNGGESVADSLNALQLTDYAALQAYAGPRKTVYVTGYYVTSAPHRIFGHFIRRDDLNPLTTAADGGTRIVGHYVWDRAYSGPVEPEWWGAIGDSDGAGGGTDDSDAIQAASNFTSIKFRLTRYKITKTITAAKFATAFIGEGNKYSGSVIDYYGSGVAIQFANTSGYNSFRHLAVHGHPITVTDYYNTGSVGVNLDACNIDMEDCWIKGFQYDVQSNYDSYYNRFVNNRFENAEVCLYRFSNNNLIVRDNRCKQFHGFLLCDGANGVANVTENWLEVFNGYAVLNLSALGQVVFEYNYIEMYWNTAAPTNFPVGPLGMFTDAILLQGHFKSLINRYNQIQLNGARRILSAVDCKHLESVGNEITDFISGSFVDQLYSIDNPSDYVHIDDVLNTLYDNNTTVVTGRTRGQSFIPMSSPDKHFYYYDAIQGKTYQASTNPKITYLTLINGWTDGEILGGVPINRLKANYTDAGLVVSGVIDCSAKTDIVAVNVPALYRAKATFSDTSYFRFQAHNNYLDTPNEAISFRYLYSTGDIRMETTPASGAKIVLDNVLIPHM